MVESPWLARDLNEGPRRYDNGNRSGLPTFCTGREGERFMAAKIHIVVRHTGSGWQVLTIGKAASADVARPYTSRDQALSDALFSARMLNALGEEVEVLLEGSDGVKPVSEETSQVWLRH